MNPAFAPAAAGDSREILSVSELNRALADLLDRNVPPLTVRGELSNVTRAASGHWYFTLKDAGAQVRAVMFRSRAALVDFAPRDGDRVEVRALAAFYQPRGEFQLQAESMRRAGAGDLYQRFIELRDRLRHEGLLDDARKRTLPSAPARVGVITSPVAAALRDVLTTLARRAPQVDVIVYPTPVQGVEAPAGIVAALRAAGLRAECGVLLLVRGGGSIEDLGAFNDESVARAIAASPIPVISGVGHQTDTTIADFVADLRAATPTAAAQAAVPDRQAQLRELGDRAQALSGRMTRLLATHEQRVDTAARLLRSPAAYLSARAEALDALTRRLGIAAGLGLRQAIDRLQHAAARLRPPDARSSVRTVDMLAARLARAAAQDAAARGLRLDALAQQLELVSPAVILHRGYAIVQRGDGTVLRDPSQVAAGERLRIRLDAGTLAARVDVDDSVA